VPTELPVGTLLAMGVVAAFYLALFGVAEVVRARIRIGADSTRPLVHVIGGLFALSLPIFFSEPWPVVVLGLGFVAFMAGTKVLGLLQAIHGVQRPTAGALVYPLGITVAFVGTGAEWPAYPVAVLALAVGDAAGGIVGRRFGTHRFRVLGTVRTVEGSLAAFVFAVLATAAVLLSRDAALFPAVGLAMVVGVVVVTVEALSPRGIDNLTIPAAVVALFALPVVS
jgi:phytol kinase